MTAFTTEEWDEIRGGKINMDGQLYRKLGYINFRDGVLTLDSDYQGEDLLAIAEICLYLYSRESK